ncbi:MAG: nucleotide exchange factor GrpE [Candidatus Nanopelagicales bacterium]|nr:nucleotide exchange factor GrpE [Candidatus Nanopelagicales bacterium]
MTERPEQTPPPEGFGPPAAGRPDSVGTPGGGAQDEGIVDAEILEGDVVPPVARQDSDEAEGEVVEPSTSEAAEVDALLAEALDADAIEAQFSAAEADLAAAAGGSGAVAEQVAVLTADLQRVHAEYSNYRKRVERDRELVRERAVESALVELLPILDDIGRARDHDELVGGFRSVGEALEAVVVRLGLTPFGAVGEPFDPTRHEALMREEREGVTEPTVVTILQVGYEMGGRVVRPARVSVAGTD